MNEDTNPLRFIKSYMAVYNRAKRVEAEMAIDKYANGVPVPKGLYYETLFAVEGAKIAQPVHAIYGTKAPLTDPSADLHARIEALESSLARHADIIADLVRDGMKLEARLDALEAAAKPADGKIEDQPSNSISHSLAASLKLKTVPDVYGR